MGQLGRVPRQLQQALEQVGLWDPQLATEAALALPEGLPPYPDGALHEEDEEYVDGDTDDIEVSHGTGRCWGRAAQAPICLSQAKERATCLQHSWP